jgi:hypothetical protein
MESLIGVFVADQIASDITNYKGIYGFLNRLLAKSFQKK